MTGHCFYCIFTIYQTPLLHSVLPFFPEITWFECDNVTASSGGETEARVPVQESSGGQASNH